METQNSIDSVREMIQKKKSMDPYMATGTCVSKVITDQDHHPYTRFFRGVYYYPDPIVIEREAGWRPIENQCYRGPIKVAQPSRAMCFEAPCSTIFPCRPRQDNTYYPCFAGDR